MLALAHAPVGPEGGHAAGRRLLERLYREQTGKPMPPILLQLGGKPFFAKGKLHFSLSHTQHHVFCALSDRPIGIDAEETDRKINLKLAEKILSAEEYAQWLAAEDQRKALLTFWVLKEAEAKYTGKGILGYPNQTRFRLDDPRVTEQYGCLIAVAEEIRSEC